MSPTEAPAPFLSVLVRTQGTREATLQEALLCLAAQTCDDFEVLVLVHDGGSGSADAVRSLVEEHHASFSSRVRVVEVSGGGRCHPLNVGAGLATGEYLATLDDDDLVFAQWVEAFREGARRAPGRVVRACVATQLVEARPGAWGGEEGYEVMGRPRLTYPLTFSYAEHLVDNQTPNNGYIVPRSLVVGEGVGWDESLPVLEDWDHLLRAADRRGVESVAEVTALVRWWAVGEDSKTAHSKEEWEATRARIVAAHDALPLTFHPGGFGEIRGLAMAAARSAEHEGELGEALEERTRELGQRSGELDARTTELAERTSALEARSRELDERSAELADRTRSLEERTGELAQARAEIEVLRRSQDALMHALADAEHALGELYASASWRVTGGLRWIAGAWRRKRRSR